MNQATNIQINDLAGRIRNIVRSKALKDTTLNNLLVKYRPENYEFYLALDMLAKQNEIFLLVTPGETYVIPVG